MHQFESKYYHQHHHDDKKLGPHENLRNDFHHTISSPAEPKPTSSATTTRYPSSNFDNTYYDNPTLRARELHKKRQNNKQRRHTTSSCGIMVRPCTNSASASSAAATTTTETLSSSNDGYQLRERRGSHHQAHFSTRRQQSDGSNGDVLFYERAVAPKVMDMDFGDRPPRKRAGVVSASGGATMNHSNRSYKLTKQKSILHHYSDISKSNNEFFCHTDNDSGKEALMLRGRQEPLGDLGSPIVRSDANYEHDCNKAHGNDEMVVDLEDDNFHQEQLFHFVSSSSSLSSSGTNKVPARAFGSYSQRNEDGKRNDDVCYGGAATNVRNAYADHFVSQKQERDPNTPHFQNDDTRFHSKVVKNNDTRHCPSNVGDQQMQRYQMSGSASNDNDDQQVYKDHELNANVTKKEERNNDDNQQRDTITPRAITEPNEPNVTASSSSSSSSHHGSINNASSYQDTNESSLHSSNDSQHQQQTHITSIFNLDDFEQKKNFLMNPCPKRAGVVQCTVVRNKTGRNKLFPEYSVYLVKNNSDKIVKIKANNKSLFLMSSKKRPNNKTSNYLISMLKNDYHRNSPNILGKLRSNFMGTEFVVYNAGLSPKDCFSGAGPPAPPAMAMTTDDGDDDDEERRDKRSQLLRSELGFVIYSTAVRNGPRQMRVGINKITIDNDNNDDEDNGNDLKTVKNDNSNGSQSTSDNANNSSSASSSMPSLPTTKKTKNKKQKKWQPVHKDEDMISCYKKQLPEKKHLFLLQNLEPEWNYEREAYVLDFGGRVTWPSVKNFQLVAMRTTTEAHSTPGGTGSAGNVGGNDVILQFGRTAKHEFTMDFQWPMSAYQAFAITLSSLDTKIAID